MVTFYIHHNLDRLRSYVHRRVRRGGHCRWSLRSVDCVSLSSWYRNWRRVPCWQRWLRREHRRVEARDKAPLGRPVHSTSPSTMSAEYFQFILFTNCQIDFGFVVGAIVPMIVVLATTESHLRAGWRICLGMGIIPPLSLLYLRLKLQEPESFKREAMVNTRTPWWLVVRFYWFRLLVVSLVWFVYDFSAYSFGIYSSSILDNLLTHGNPNATYPLWKSFGWNTLLNVFYMPGCIAGSFISDTRLGPKWTLIVFMVLQSIVGYIMAACYGTLSKPEHVGAFVVVYGIFLALGEVGPGDNIGLCASKTSATAIRLVALSSMLWRHCR